MKAITYRGDCLPNLKKLPTHSVHSVVTDPPAGIGFLGHEWDKDKGGRDQWIAWLQSVMEQCHRVLKPGGHAIIWALPRTSHWTATAVEDAGFEIRDIITHIFTSGVPASGEIGVKVDRVLGADPKVVGYKPNPCSTYYNGDRRNGPIPVYEPQTPLGKKWSGWMPKLKPAAEHWIIARKPLGRRNLAENAIVYETGSLNIEDCRVVRSPVAGDNKSNQKGRFPSNLLLSHQPSCGQECAENCVVASVAKHSNLHIEEFFNTFYFSSKAPKRERQEGTVHDKE